MADAKPQLKYFYQDTDEQSGAKPQPKILYWTQMNTDKHRFYRPKNQCKKTEWDTDEHG